MFYREELTAVRDSQHAVVADLALQCDSAEIPLIVEPLWYPLEGESLDDPVVRTSRATAITGPHVSLQTSAPM